MPDLNRRTCLGGLGLGGLGLGVSGLCRLAMAAPPGLEPDGLKADADLLRRAYTALHPGLLRYQTADEAEARFACLRAELGRAESLSAAYLALARVTAAVRCGHSFPNPANQEGLAGAMISDGRNRLPFRFAWLDGRMIVLERSDAYAALLPGAEVESIGGVSCRHLLRELMWLVPADGHNDAKRVRSLDLRGQEEWPLFDVLLAFTRPELVVGGVACLRVSGPSGAPARTVDVALLSRAEREATARAGIVSRGSSEPAWRLERLASGVGWLTMSSWAVFDSKWDWRTALDNDFDRLAADRAKGLVIDLRGNAGGLDVGEVILSRLVESDTPKTAQRRLVRYRQTPAELNPYLKTWDQRFRNWGDAAVGPDAKGFYALARDDDGPADDLIRPRGRRFTGKVVVLVDAANSSATFGFAQTLKALNMATLVGQTTGGNRRGINGGAFFFLRLPSSGLEVDLPLIGYFPTSKQLDAGLEPDIPVRMTVEDVARGHDPERAAALACIAM